EIQRLVAHARRLRPPGSLRPYTYSTLFGLLAATGMRPSEARALQLSDLTPDGLLVRETKFKKSRLLPLHDTTWLALEGYLDQRRRSARPDPHLFISLRGGPLSTPTVSLDVMCLVASSCGYGKGQIACRIAHSFAVHVAS